MKKTLALILTFIMVLALVPTVAFAEEPKTIYVDAKNGNDDQEGVGTTSDKAYKSLDKAMEAAGSTDASSAVKVEKTSISMVCSQFNAVKEITIPEEAKSAESISANQ